MAKRTEGDERRALVLEEISRRILGLETLETRGSDSLDFSDQSVWNLKAALEAAYLAGQEDRRNDDP